MPQPEVKSPLLELEQLAKMKPNYNDDEIKYIGGLQTRLEHARRMRDTHHTELDGMTYVENWDLEEKGANTFIAPKVNKSDTTYQSGTIRQKLFALLAHIVNLDLSGDINAYDSNELEVQSLGASMEVVIEKCEQLDGDDEKKLMRFYELLKHGTIFIEELWEEKYLWAKKVLVPFEGIIKSAKWKKKLKMVYARPTRNVLSGLNVYLGDITKYSMCDQPYVFTVNYMSYEEAKATWGEWERFQYVTKSKAQFAPELNSSIIYNTWRLTEVAQDQVEVIKYQDKWNNEWALILNGVLMTPVGMPLPWGYEDYCIVQQNLEPIHPYFAYGKSLISKLRTMVGIYDEMQRLAILKTQKSFMPPRFNLSGRVVSSRVFMPSVITAGLSPADLPLADPEKSDGVSMSEFNMMQDLRNTIDNNSVSPTFAGQQTTKQTTATEVLEMQRQAKQTLGTVIIACSLLEWKLNWLRLFTILENWFNPLDQVVDETRNTLINKYRIVSAQRPVSGQGMGQHIIYPTDQQVSPDQIYQEEERIAKEAGKPTKITVINPDQLKTAKYIWQITIVPREKKSSEMSKLLFRGFMQDIQVFGPTINLEYLQEEFASVWDKNPTKLFQKAPAPMEMPQNVGAPGGAPGVKIPGMPDMGQMMNKEIGNKGGMGMMNA